MPPYRDFAINLAIQVGALLKQRFRPSGTPATLKADRSFVTEVDLAADKMISESIKKAASDELLLSEELQTSVESLDPAVWIVDPLDGTTNYSLGLQVWGVSLARLVHGQPVLGVLYFPILDELYVAELGKGAYLNDDPIHTRPPDPNFPRGFFACCSRTYKKFNIAIPYKARIFGSSAYSFCMLARGSALVAFETTPKIWDLAAVWLIVQEAGGAIAPYNGETPFPILPKIDYVSRSLPTLAAASVELLTTSRSQISLKT